MWKVAFFQDSAAKFFSTLANISFRSLEAYKAYSLPATFTRYFYSCGS